LHNLRYKLVVADLDGTLLNDRTEITGRALRAIAAFHEAGGYFTYATGRTDESAKMFAEQAGVKAPGISFNGGKIVSIPDGRVIYETFLDAGCAKAAFKALREYKKDVVVYMDTCRFVGEYTDVVDRYLDRVRLSAQVVGDIDRAIGDGAGLKKMIVIDPKHESDLIISTAKPLFGEKYNFVMSSPEFYEFLPPGTSKGAALKILAGYLGIGLDETAAIGDHLNDVSMIAAAGLGVAVANAAPEALAAARYITASNDDDGVAELLEKLLGADGGGL